MKINTEMMKDSLRAYFEVQEEAIANFVKRVAETKIVDKLVRPKSLTFLHDGARLLFRVDDSGREYPIHGHALSQICSRVEFPAIYRKRLYTQTDWKLDLLVTNLNELFRHTQFESKRKKEPAAFLLRFVDNELRGFVSRNFGRHIASIPTLNAFLAACRQIDAVPTKAESSSTHYALTAYQPLVFEPLPGEFVAFGVRWANSDFSSGALQVSASMLHIGRRTNTVIASNFSRVHLGPMIKEGDLELSADTLAKEVEAVCGGIRDCVQNYLSGEAISRYIEAIQAAGAETIPWHKLKARLKDYLHKEELENIEKFLDGESALLDLPPPGSDPSTGEPLPTLWWASSLLSEYANRVTEPERKDELQYRAGEFLEIDR